MPLSAQLVVTGMESYLPLAIGAGLMLLAGSALAIVASIRQAAAERAAFAQQASRSASAPPR